MFLLWRRKWGSSILKSEDIEGNLDDLVAGKFHADVELQVLLQASGNRHCFPESVVGRVCPVRGLVVERGTSEDFVFHSMGN
jgi:hypothetical protein